LGPHFFAECEFSFERDLLGKTAPKSKGYRRQDLAAEFMRRNGFAMPAGIKRVDLKWSEELFKNEAAFQALKFDLKEIPDQFEAYASYFCLYDEETKKSYIVRAKAQK
jgi:hypothetical protein